ncbi:probable LRR receptor-like serine/threonine-protein kinase At1g07650 [Fagus crenata]
MYDLVFGRVPIDGPMVALRLKEEGNLIKLIDPRLELDYNKEEMMVMIHVALLCTNVSAASRPTMSSVVSMLEGNTIVPDYNIVPDLGSDTSFAYDEMKTKELQKYYLLSEEYNLSESKTQSMSMDGPSTAASSSAADLYPINLDSGYLQNRD